MKHSLAACGTLAILALGPVNHARAQAPAAAPVQPPATVPQPLPAPPVPAPPAPSVPAPPAPSVSAPPLPQAAGADEVLLKNGGMLRGTVVSLEPGKEVIITVQGTNQTRTLPWAEVDKVNRAPSTPPAPAAPPASSYGQTVPPSAPTLQPGPGTPRLHIDTTNGAVVLQRVDLQFAAVGPGGTAYGAIVSPVCQAPCDQIVDGRKGQAFFFGGDGVPESPPFKLNDRSGNLSIKVAPGSSAGRAAGSVLSTLGFVGVLTGLILLPVGAAVGSHTDANGSPSTTGKTMLISGGISLGAGAVALTTGIVLLVTTATKVQFPEQKAIAGSKRPGSFAFGTF